MGPSVTPDSNRPAGAGPSRFCTSHAEPSDLSELRRLDSAAGRTLAVHVAASCTSSATPGSSRSRDTYLADILDPDRLVLIGSIGTAVVGFAVVSTAPLERGYLLADINEIFVEADARDVGVGEALIELDYRLGYRAGVPRAGLKGTSGGSQHQELLRKQRSGRPCDLGAPRPPRIMNSRFDPWAGAAEPRPRLSIAAIVERRDEMLLVRRSGGPVAGSGHYRRCCSARWRRWPKLPSGHLRSKPDSAPGSAVHSWVGPNSSTTPPKRTRS